MKFKLGTSDGGIVIAKLEIGCLGVLSRMLDSIEVLNVGLAGLTKVLLSRFEVGELKDKTLTVSYEGFEFSKLGFLNMGSLFLNAQNL